MAKQLLKGNDAVIRSAALSGCRLFFGYPITPASEITESAAKFLPRIGGTFLQAESEVSAINMVYGAAASGIRVMTASSSPGISLKLEGISYAAGAELPLVIVDVNRGGPGLGNIAPEQSDYNQVCKGGGHGNYKTPVLAPASVQEMADLVALAFELADTYRTPVFVLADGVIGQMMEPVEFPPARLENPRKDWALYGDGPSKHNLISSIHLEPEALEAHNLHLQDKYHRIEQAETRWEEYRTEDADHVFVGYGIVSRLLKSVVDSLRAQGIRAGLLRPISLVPFPAAALLERARTAEDFTVVEMNNGQMVHDVRLAVECSRPVLSYTRMGGVVPTPKEILDDFLRRHETAVEGC